jgi:drug/metabolite transporter (DMT)-like permease
MFGLLIAWLVFKETIWRRHAAAVAVSAFGALCIALS